MDLVNCSLLGSHKQRCHYTRNFLEDISRKGTNSKCSYQQLLSRVLYSLFKKRQSIFKPIHLQRQCDGWTQDGCQKPIILLLLLLSQRQGPTVVCFPHISHSSLSRWLHCIFFFTLLNMFFQAYRQIFPGFIFVQQWVHCRQVELSLSGMGQSCQPPLPLLNPSHICLMQFGLTDVDPLCQMLVNFMCKHGDEATPAQYLNPEESHSMLLKSAADIQYLQCTEILLPFWIKKVTPHLARLSSHSQMLSSPKNVNRSCL